MLKVITTAFLATVTLAQPFGEDAIYTVNTKRALHGVSDKFLSVSIDPSILLTGLNLSDTSLQLAKHLSPAYIRIAGPSTHFVKYEETNSEERWESDSVLVTPTMWFGINEWLSAANLTPVFGINDRETTVGEWNPHSTMPLLDISDKFNISCYWQLGYDCSNKTEARYKSDLRRFHHILEAFPDKKNIWKVVGSDLSKCIDHPDSVKRVLDEMENILGAVVWEPTTTNERLFLEEHIGRLLSLPIRPKVPIWLVAPKCSHSVTFSTAISWAKQVGEAAKIGYEVIFRQPRFHEIFTETPPFWVSLLHKILMGRTVLDVKSASGQDPQVSVYAHCSRHQNNFIRSGAMTVFTVNNSTQNHTVLLRMGTVSLKNTEVQSYVLTSSGDGATEVFLNGDKLSLNSFSGDKMNLLPKLRRAKIVNYLSLTLPAKSVAFFVLPAARVPVCIHDEEDVKEIMEEIQEDQKIPFSEEVSVEVNPRFFPHRSPTLRELQHQMEEEMQSDEKYYKQVKNYKREKPKKVLHEEMDGRHYLLERARLNENQRKQLDHGRRVEFKPHPERLREPPPTTTPLPRRVFELELTSAEIRKVLADRAKAKAARKHIIFTSEELEEIMDKATDKFLKDKNTSIRIRKKSKRDASQEKRDINMKLLKLKTLGEKRKLLLKHMGQRLRPNHDKREKRDINMNLLKLKTEHLLNSNSKKPDAPVRRLFENNEAKEATIREPGQTSDEFLQPDIVETKDDGPEDIFAQLADPDDIFLTPTTTEKYKFGLKHHKNKPINLFSTHKPILPKVDHIRRPTVRPVVHHPSQQLVVYEDGQGFDDEEYDEDLFSVEDNEENFACIHEFSGGHVNNVNDSKTKISELWEIGMEPVEEKRKLPELKNRGFEVEGVSKNDKSFIENDYEELEDDSSDVRLKRRTDVSDVSDQQVKERFNKRYKSLTEGLKIWKPSDILALRRLKRSGDNYVNSVENEIDNFMNEIAKEAKVVDAKLVKGDYQLVFPNKDKIEVQENKGDTEVKLVLHGNSEEVTTTEKSNIQKIWKKHDDNVWQKLLKKVTKFFQRLSVKLKNYMLEDVWK